MTHVRAYVNELVRAVAVLSLLLFALAQAYPAAAAPDSSAVASLAAASTALAAGAPCGSDHADLSHSASHACRFDAAALPPPPCAAQAVLFHVAVVTWPTLVAPVPPLLVRANARSRAPPQL